MMNCELGTRTLRSRFLVFNCLSVLKESNTMTHSTAQHSTAQREKNSLCAIEGLA